MPQLPAFSAPRPLSQPRDLSLFCSVGSRCLSAQDLVVTPDPLGLSLPWRAPGHDAIHVPGISSRIKTQPSLV